MKKTAYPSKRFGLALLLALLLQSCGGIIVGNPHGAGSSGKQPPTGQIQFMLVSNESKKYSKASLNIKSFSLVKALQRETIKLESSRRLETVKVKNQTDPYAGFSFFAPADRYDRIEIELDDANPASVVTNDGAEAVMFTQNNRRKLALQQGFVVDPDKTSSLRLFLDLDRSIVRAVDGSEIYSFSPVGELTKPDAFRQLQILGIGLPLNHVCVFYERSDMKVDPIVDGIYAPISVDISSSISSQEDYATIEALPAIPSYSEEIYQDIGVVPNTTMSSQEILSDMNCDQAIASFSSVYDVTTALPYPGRYAVFASFGNGNYSSQLVDLTLQSEATVVFDGNNDSGFADAVMPSGGGTSVEAEADIIDSKNKMACAAIAPAPVCIRTKLGYEVQQFVQDLETCEFLPAVQSLDVVDPLFCGQK